MTDDIDHMEVVLADIRDYAVFRVSAEGRIASWNVGAERIKGWRAEEIIGQPFALLFTPEDVAQGRPEWEMHVAATRGVYQGEGVRVRKGGERFHAEVTLRALAPSGDRARGFVKVTRDITERFRVEEELRRRAAFERQLIGIVSHDLRTPIGAITLSAGALLHRPGLEAAVTHGLRRILGSAERAGRMIHDLLDYTLVKAGGGFTLQRRPLDLHELVELVVQEVRQAWPGRPIRFKHRGEGLGALDADRTTQLLVNLLSNALQHGDPHAPVTATSAGEGDRLRLSVHNLGPPIPPELLPRLFLPMEQDSRQALPRSDKSLGLGLFICEQIAHAHGGAIEVRSDAAAGTLFTVDLPRALSVQESAVPA